MELKFIQINQVRSDNENKGIEKKKLQVKRICIYKTCMLKVYMLWICCIHAVYEFSGVLASIEYKAYIELSNFYVLHAYGAGL